MKLLFLNLNRKKLDKKRNVISLEEFYNEEDNVNQFVSSPLNVSLKDKKAFKKNAHYWETGKIDKKKYNSETELISFEHEKFSNSEHFYNQIEQHNVNKYFDNIINIVSKKILNYPYEKNIFMYYKRYDKNKFSFSERKKVKKYLKRYFMFRNNHFVLIFNRNYNKLNSELHKISKKINIPNISSYEEFMNFGNIYYNIDREPFPKESIKENKAEKLEISNTSQAVKKINENKINKVTTPEIEQLKSKRRKLLNKIKKLELLKEKKLIQKDEVLLYKKMVLDTENQIKSIKENSKIYIDNIQYSNEIRKRNSTKALETYFKRYNRGKIKESIDEYFGEEQIEYFKSLDIYDQLYEKNKMKTK